MLLLVELSHSRTKPSLYWEFEELVKMLSKRHPQNHGIALMSLLESVWIYLSENRKVEKETVREALILDYAGPGKRDIPAFLRQGHERAKQIPKFTAHGATPKRQLARLSVSSSPPTL